MSFASDNSALTLKIKMFILREMIFWYCIFSWLLNAKLLPAMKDNGTFFPKTNIQSNL
jgi:hypothetical protein